MESTLQVLGAMSWVTKLRRGIQFYYVLVREAYAGFVISNSFALTLFWQFFRGLVPTKRRVSSPVSSNLLMLDG